MSLKNWTTIFKSVKKGGQGFLNYTRYLKNDKHPNHTKPGHKIIPFKWNKYNQNQSIKNMTFFVERRYKENIEKGKGGRPPSKYGQSIVISLPFEVEEEKLHKAAANILYEYYLRMLKLNNIELSKEERLKEFNKYLDRSFINFHTQPKKGSQTQFNFVLSEFLLEDTKIDMSKKIYSYEMKESVNLQVKRQLNIDNETYNPEQIKLHKTPYWKKKQLQKQEELENSVKRQKQSEEKTYQNLLNYEKKKKEEINIDLEDYENKKRLETLQYLKDYQDRKEMEINEEINRDIKYSKELYIIENFDYLVSAEDSILTEDIFKERVIEQIESKLFSYKMNIIKDFEESEEVKKIKNRMDKYINRLENYNPLITSTNKFLDTYKNLIKNNMKLNILKKEKVQIQEIKQEIKTSSTFTHRQ